MFRQIDWVFLRQPLIIFTILFGIAIALYMAGLEYKNFVQTDFNQAKAALAKSHQKLKKQSSDAELVDTYLSRYKQLKNNGYIGEERRLSWIEAVKATDKKLKLPKFNYTIKPQSAFIRAGIKKNKTVKSLSSVMEIELSVLHEGDVFQVFSELKKHVQSRFVVDSCKFSKLRNSELRMREANLSARCSLRWINVEVKK